MVGARETSPLRCWAARSTGLDELVLRATSVPELLDALEIAGCTVTLDAIHCQTETVETIVDKGADYIALNLLRRETSAKRSIKGKRMKAALDEKYLLKVLVG
jgi:predicted transposase YbfD/YdcC